MNAKLKSLIVLGAVAVVWFGLRLLTGPSAHPALPVAIDVSADPVQTIISDAEPITIAFDEGHAELTPIAEYTIHAKVCGRQKYTRPWQALISPYDLCLSWGKVATENLKGTVKFSQDMRWYQFRVKRDSLVDVSYISSHSANTHILPASANLKKAVARLNKGDRVLLEGYLVNITGSFKGEKIGWTSSQSRQDTGNGACEVFYLKSLRTKGKLYL